MAHLTEDEFREFVALLAAEMGTERLRDRLVRLGAFTSRRGMSTPASLAGRLYQLSAGLRRPGPAAAGLEAVWRERTDEKVGAERRQRLEALADRVNACLTPRGDAIADRAADLDEALGEYRSLLTECLSPQEAHLDMLLKAVPAVAARIRDQARDILRSRS